MDNQEELSKYIKKIDGHLMRMKLIKTYSVKNEAQIQQDVDEVADLLDEMFEKDNKYSSDTRNTFLSVRGDFGIISQTCISSILAILKSAQTKFNRNYPGGLLKKPLQGIFVDIGRISELKCIRDSKFDLSKLIRFCEELNVAAKNDCFMAVAMISRAIIDHVPPVFGCATFSEVANNYSGNKSFKDSMQHLNNFYKKIADGFLHVQIRNKEALPNISQVNCSSEIDLLLSEIIRILSVRTC